MLVSWLRAEKVGDQSEWRSIIRSRESETQARVAVTECAPEDARADKLLLSVVGSAHFCIAAQRAQGAKCRRQVDGSWSSRRPDRPTLRWMFMFAAQEPHRHSRARRDGGERCSRRLKTIQRVLWQRADFARENGWRRRWLWMLFCSLAAI